jgi:hypothetical protein
MPYFIYRFLFHFLNSNYYNAVKGLRVPDNESMLMIIDSTIMGSGKEGMALTDWGVRYNDGVKSWNLTWNDLSEKYSFTIIKTDGALGVKADALLLQAKPGDEFAVNKEISMSMADIKYDILERILSKSCQIYTGKSVDTMNPNINNIPVSDHKVQNQPKPTQTTKKVPEKLTFFQHIQKGIWRVQELLRERKLKILGIERSNMLSIFSSTLGEFTIMIIHSFLFWISKKYVFGFTSQRWAE